MVAVTVTQHQADEREVFQRSAKKGVKIAKIDGHIPPIGRMTLPALGDSVPVGDTGANVLGAPVVGVVGCAGGMLVSVEDVGLDSEALPVSVGGTADSEVASVPVGSGVSALLGSVVSVLVEVGVIDIEVTGVGWSEHSLK